MWKRFLPIIAVGLLAAGATFADGVDGHIVIGEAPPGSPPCTSFSSVADGSGVIDTDCTIFAGTFATSLTFAVPDADTDGGLTVTIDSSTLPGWVVQSCSTGTIDECTIVPGPPVTPAESLSVAEELLALGELGNPNLACAPPVALTFGIPGGCDVTFTTATGQDFTPGATFTVTANNALPEPATLSLVAMGLLALPFARRRFVQQS